MASVAIAFLPSNHGFQLPSDRAPRVLRLPPIAHTPSPLARTPTNQRAGRVLLAGLWGNNYGSSSAKDDGGDEETDDETNDESDETAKEQDDDSDNDRDAVAASSSYETAEALLPTDDLELVAATDSNSNANANANANANDTGLTNGSNSSVDGSSTAAKSLWVLLNEIGNNFKDMAQKATAKGSESDAQSKKIIYAAQGCVYYALFILYRTYRGFFVLLPATFLQVYRKMEDVMGTGNLSLDEIDNDDDVGKTTTTWRTKLTVSILSTVVTLSYVAGGLLKMTTRFLRTIAKTSDVSKSFEAAADEVVDFEGRISRVGKANGKDGVDLGVVNVNDNINDDSHVNSSAKDDSSVGNPGTSGLAP